MAVAQGRALGAAGAELAADERSQGQRWRRQTRLPDPGGGRHGSRRSGPKNSSEHSFEGRAEERGWLVALVRVGWDLIALAAAAAAATAAMEGGQGGV